MDMNKYAKENDLARKFEAAIQQIDVGKGWNVFAGLDKGEATVRVVYDGEIRFLAVEKEKPKKRKRVKPGDTITSDTENPDVIEVVLTTDMPEPEDDKDE